MPSNVVYQETTESKQLATKSAWTIGRLTPADPTEGFEDTNGIAQYSLRTVTHSVCAWFQIIRFAKPSSDRLARRAGPGCNWQATRERPAPSLRSAGTMHRAGERRR